MAKVILNPLAKQMYGKSGNMIFRRTPKGETIVYSAPEKPGETLTPADPDKQKLWTDAHAYARQAMADPEMSAYYEQEAKRLHRDSPYNVAFSNYLRMHKRTVE